MNPTPRRIAGARAASAIEAGSTALPICAMRR